MISTNFTPTQPNDDELSDCEDYMTKNIKQKINVTRCSWEIWLQSRHQRKCHTCQMSIVTNSFLLTFIHCLDYEISKLSSDFLLPFFFFRNFLKSIHSYGLATYCKFANTITFCIFGLLFVVSATNDWVFLQRTVNWSLRNLLWEKWMEKCAIDVV